MQGAQRVRTNQTPAGTGGCHAAKQGPCRPRARKAQHTVIIIIIITNSSSSAQLSKDSAAPVAKVLRSKGPVGATVGMHRATDGRIVSPLAEPHAGMQAHAPHKPPAATESISRTTQDGGFMKGQLLNSHVGVGQGPEKSPRYWESINPPAPNY